MMFPLATQVNFWPACNFKSLRIDWGIDNWNLLESLDCSIFYPFVNDTETVKYFKQISKAMASFLLIYFLIASSWTWKKSRINRNFGGVGREKREVRSEK
jgi:hypothetical protein